MVSLLQHSHNGVQQYSQMYACEQFDRRAGRAQAGAKGGGKVGQVTIDRAVQPFHDHIFEYLKLKVIVNQNVCVSLSGLF